MNEPLKYYINEGENALELYLINVGQGLMVLLIFPNKVTMLFDCYITNDTEDGILSCLESYIPYRKNDEGNNEQWIDIFVNSHRDQDHYKGLKSINKKFTIKSIWDSGQYGTGAASGSEDYNYYMYLKREVKEKYGEDAVPKVIPSNIPFRVIEEVSIYCLNSKQDCILKEGVQLYPFKICEPEESISEAANIKKQHTNCIVLLIEYKGKKIILTGDSDWKSWMDNVVENFKENNFLKSDILIASHHGSKSFFTDESNDNINVELNPDTTYLDSISYINPTITLISCGNYEKYHHPNKQAVDIYMKNTSNQQVYSTKEKDATFIGFIKSNGELGVTTSNFVNFKSDSELDFDLICIMQRDGQSKEISNGEEIKIGCSFKFIAKNIRGIADSIVKENVSVTWEVSNVGKGNDVEHQEIYFKGKQKRRFLYSANIDRDLVYEGVHMVRCTIENRDRNKLITKVFYVKAVK